MMEEEQLKKERDVMVQQADQMAKDLITITHNGQEVERNLMRMRGAIAMIDRMLVYHASNGATAPTSG